MLPTTGPTTSVSSGRWPPGLDPFNPPSSDYVNHEVSKTRWRQTKPYNLQLPMTFIEQRVLLFPSNGVSHRFPHFDAINSSGVDGAKGQLSDSVLLNWALEKAHNRFRSKIGEGAAWMTNYVERKQAISTMASRLTSMTTFAVKLRRFDFVGAYKALIHEDLSPGPKGLTPAQRLRRKRQKLSSRAIADKKFKALLQSGRLKRGSKWFANNFLEYHFFWSPTVSDIYATTDILQQEISPSRIKASATVKRSLDIPFSGLSGSTHYSGVEKVRIGGMVTVSNPNLWLANQLGVINPALWIYEAITLSFVANWLVNIESFLTNFTRYAGLSITDAYHTISHSETREWEVYSVPAYYVAGKNTSFRVDRVMGLPPGPGLHIRQPWDLSPRRAAAAVSLLLQKLK